MDAKTPAGTDTVKSIFMQALQNMTLADQKVVVTKIKSFSVAHIPVWMVMHSSGGRCTITLCTCVDMHHTNCCHIMQEHVADFPVLACIMQDILAILGVSISVEHLFSGSKHTFSDLQSSMTAKSALKTVVVKEWLKKGFRDGMNYLNVFGIQE